MLERQADPRRDLFTPDIECEGDDPQEAGGVELGGGANGMVATGDVLPA